jgi:hypothetical protein
LLATALAVVIAAFAKGQNLVNSDREDLSVSRVHHSSRIIVQREKLVRFRMSEFVSQTPPMIKDALRQELQAMRSEDLRVREELIASGELGGEYVPKMEDVYKRNASRLRELIDLHGWPTEDIAGKDGSEAAWQIAQHAIGEPELQRYVLEMLRVSIAKGHVPPWQAANLEDRIAMYEGQPQRYGTQGIDDPRDGRIRPWTIADPKNLNALRAEVGLEPLRPVPEPGPELPAEERENLERNHRWWREWLTSKGWRRPE